VVDQRKQTFHFKIHVFFCDVKLSLFGMMVVAKKYILNVLFFKDFSKFIGLIKKQSFVSQALQKYKIGFDVIQLEVSLELH
jgi:hypothetical protein